MDHYTHPVARLEHDTGELTTESSSVDRGAAGPRQRHGESNSHGADATVAAERLCAGFLAHDERNRERALDSFAALDTAQFSHLDASEARAAAAAYVEALWEKDRSEWPYTDGRTIVDPDGLAGANWDRVSHPLERRAGIVGMDVAYATELTDAWRRHATGGDYREAMVRAQRREFDAAMGTNREHYSFEGPGPGHPLARYILGIELDDEHTERHRTQAVAILGPYFAAIFEERAR